MEKILTLFAVVILSTSLLVFALWWNTSRQFQLQTESFYNEVLRLEVGKSTGEDVWALVRSRQERTVGSFEPCHSGSPNCAGTIYFENFNKMKWLYRMHLATPMAFSFAFTVEDHKLKSRWLAMVFVPNGNEGAFVQEKSNTRAFPDQVFHRPEETYFRISGGYPSGYMGVFIAPGTPPDLRKLAYNFNFNCLAKPRGCSTYEQMLPVLGRRDLY